MLLIQVLHKTASDSLVFSCKQQKKCQPVDKVRLCVCVCIHTLLFAVSKLHSSVVGNVTILFVSSFHYGTFNKSSLQSSSHMWVYANVPLQMLKQLDFIYFEDFCKYIWEMSSQILPKLAMITGKHCEKKLII